MSARSAEAPEAAATATALVPRRSLREAISVGPHERLWALGAVGLVAGLALVPVFLASRLHPSQALIFVSVATGWVFIASGLVAWWRRPDSRVGALMYATGLAWFVGRLGYSDDAWLYTLSCVFGSVFAATAVHLLLAFPSGRLPGRFERALVTAGYAVTTVATIPALMFINPARTGCTQCAQNRLLLRDDPATAALLTKVVDGLAGAVLLCALVALVRRWRYASPPQRRVLAPVYVAGLGVLVVFAVVLATTVVGLPNSARWVIADLSVAPFAAVPVLFLAGLAFSRMSRGGAVGSLVARLGQADGRVAVRDALAEALGDRGLRLAYWLPDSQRYVDANGDPTPLGQVGDAVTDVRLDGRRVGAVVHDPAFLEDGELLRAVGAAAALAMERERLEAELRARVQELEASRSRMLDAAVSERRRLERDLHDGAQQRLVSLALSLRVARRRLPHDPADASRLLESAAGELEAALAELRELARGIHPAVLADRGLDAAIHALAARAPLPVEFVGTLGRRLPEPVELAAYFVVAEALTNVAKYAHATHATVRTTHETGAFAVEIEDDGQGGADPDRGSGLRGLADRVSALDGRLGIDSTPGRGTIIRARIPLPGTDGEQPTSRHLIDGTCACG
ncbi:MAG: hypothetical protein JO153_01435 [Solirubrobacterales bacterium]|nr:hypothetical protein [Solirubrobacterales bacterium]